MFDHFPHLSDWFSDQGLAILLNAAVFLTGLMTALFWYQSAIPGRHLPHTGQGMSAVGSVAHRDTYALRKNRQGAVFAAIAVLVPAAACFVPALQRAALLPIW